MTQRHNAILEDRARLMLTGVTDVESFDEKLSEMSLESGELTVEGDICSLSYGERDATKKLGFFGKLFR